MFVESLEEVPENWRDKFEEVEIDGKKGFQDKETTKAFNMAKNIKLEKQTLQEKLNGFESSKAAEIEAAREQALEEAKTKGDVAAIEKQYQEQMADLERRTADKVKAEMEKDFNVRESKKNAEIDLVDIVSSLKPLDDTKAILKMAVEKRQTIDESGKIVYLNADGSASTLDKNGLIAELKQDAAIKRLIQADHNVSGGGNINGSNGGSASFGNMGGNRQERAAAIKAKFNLTE